MGIVFSSECAKMRSYVYDFDDQALPGVFDDLPRSIEHALTRGRRYLEYAELARRKLDEVQAALTGGKSDE